MLDFQTVKGAAHGRWLEIWQALGVHAETLTGKHTHCAGCGGKNRFRAVPTDPDGKWFCGQGGSTTGGDGFGLLCHVFGWTKGEALRAVANHLGIQPDQSPKARQKARKRALLAKAAQLEEALLHEIMVLNIALNTRATDRQLARDHKYKDAAIWFRPMPADHWQREELAARRIVSLINKLYLARVLDSAA